MIGQRQNKIMSYYKEDKNYEDMTVKELQECKRKHYENPKYFLKLMKPPFYYTWDMLLDGHIERAKNKIL